MLGLPPKPLLTSVLRSRRRATWQSRTSGDISSRWLAIENAKLFRECEKLKRDIAEVRRVRDGLRAEVYRLRREVARTAQKNVGGRRGRSW